MNKQIISDRQGISIVVLFIIGSSSVFTMGLQAGRDLWLATILAIVMALPMALIYARLHNLFPDRDLFDIIEICFGKIIGKGIIILFTFFIFYWTGDVLANYGNFITVVSLTDTPQVIPMIFLTILCAFGIKSGIEVLGRWSEYFLKLPIIILVMTVILLIPEMLLNNIRPVLYNGMKPVFQGAFDSFSFPFSQIVAFTMAFSNFNKKKSVYNIYIKGLIIGGAYLLILSLVDIFVLGVNISEIINYPSYTTIARIHIGDTLQRIEVGVALIFVIGGFVKISILLLCTCKGITKIFGFRKYKFIITPVTLLVIDLCFFQYEGIIDYSEFQTEVWAYFTFPFHVILPIIILIAAEIKKRRIQSET